MSVKLRDKSLQVSFIQIYLKERSGMSLDFDETSETYQITHSKSLRVTGTYDAETYTSLALFMGTVYPEEGFPEVWSYGPDENGENSWFHEKYDPTIHESLVDVVVSNLSYLPLNPEIAQLSPRIFSYLIGEVVTPESDDDEIYRVQQLMYPDLVTSRIGKYDEKMTEDVKRVQSQFLSRYQDSLPEGYEDFRVTGFVDPWTELILGGGSDVV